MITELHTVALYVADQDRAKHFYVETLGFDVSADQPGLGGIGRWLEVTPKGAQTAIMLADAAGWNKQDRIGSSADLTLRCDDARALHAELSAKGVPVTEPTTQRFGTFIDVTDPDGHRPASSTSREEPSLIARVQDDWRVAAENRVTPLGDIAAFPLRGAFTGNRGRLHEGRRIVRFHAGDLWIICALRFKDRWNEQWLPRRFTWLYFHDEAVALAAGHRPCGECRHASYVAYREGWAYANSAPSPPSARDMNRQLHRERIVRGTHHRRMHPMSWRELPDGAFVLHADGAPHAVVGKELVEWTRDGYATRRPRPTRGQATVITPPSSLSVLRAGYPVQIDPTALG